MTLLLVYLVATASAYVLGRWSTVREREQLVRQRDEARSERDEARKAATDWMEIAERSAERARKPSGAVRRIGKGPYSA